MLGDCATTTKATGTTRMAISYDDLITIKKELDERYVLQSDCETTQTSINKKFANDDKRIEIVVHDFKVIKWLISTVAAASISSLVVAIFELILR